jgi:hypothetical protein
MKQIVITGVQAKRIQDDAKRVRVLINKLRAALEKSLRDLREHPCLCNGTLEEIDSLVEDFGLDLSD